MLAAAEAGDPLAFVALNDIVTDLRVLHQRLERTADAAEKDNQRLAVASLPSQQLRAAEVRAKIGRSWRLRASKRPRGRRHAGFLADDQFIRWADRAP